MAKGYAKETMKILKAYYPHRKMNNRPISEVELNRRLAMIPEDTRDFTGRIMGDPYPNDRRRRK